MNSLDQDLARTMMEFRLAAARQRQLVRFAKASRQPTEEQGRRVVASWLRRLLPDVRRGTAASARTERTAARSRLRAVPQAHRGCSPAPADDPAAEVAELADLLDTAAHSIVERGTPTERPLLEILAAATVQRRPGAAAALVDWSGSEVARLRAFGIVHGLVLALAPHEQRMVLARIRGGSALPLAG